MGGAGGPVVFGVARLAAVHDDADPVQGERGFGDCGGKHDAPPTFRITPDRHALSRRLHLSVKRQHQRRRQAFGKTLSHAFDFAHAG